MTVATNPPFDQYIATNGQTVFNYTFEIVEQTDLLVYQRLNTDAPNDLLDVLTLNVDYTVTGVGAENGGTVVLNVGAALNDIVSIKQNVPVQRDTSFTPGGILRAQDLNSEFDNQTLIEQVSRFNESARMLSYWNSAIVVPFVDTIIPVLGANQVWIKNANNDEIVTFQMPGDSGLAPNDALYLVQTPNQYLPNAFNMGALGDGVLKQTVALGIATPALAINEVDIYAPGMTGYLESPVGIKDLDGNIVVAFSHQANPANHIAITNSPTNTAPGFNSTGADAIIGMGFAAKSSGVFNFYSTGVNVVQFHTGTGYQRVSQFAFADVSAGYTYTFPEASGTIALLEDGVVSVEGTEFQVLVNGTFGTPQAGDLILTLPQDIDPTSSPTFASETIGDMFFSTSTIQNLLLITDEDGDPVFAFDASNNPVNYVRVASTDTGLQPGFTALGGDTNIGIHLIAKAAGQHELFSTSDTPLLINNGTAYQRLNAFTFADVAGSFTYTFPDANGVVVLNGSSPTFNDVTVLGNFIDSNGNDILHLSGVPMAVNFFAISNVPSGNLPVWAVGGADADVGMSINAKGAGIFKFISAATSNQIHYELGTTYQFTAIHNYPNTANTRTYTFPDNSGTIALLSDIPAATTPTVQTFTSGSGTYTTPANVAYIRVRMVGGGGGASESGTAAGTPATAGGNTTFGTALLVANGGGAAVFGLSGGAGGGTGGAASIASPAYGTALTGGSGGGGVFKTVSTINLAGACGAASFFGGQGRGGQQQVAGGNGAANTGGGGGGAGGGNGLSSDTAGNGGGSGGYVEAFIPTPGASYAYAVGAGGTGGTAGTSGFAGGNGGSGYIEVTEYY
jgi:hypothetical protein